MHIFKIFIELQCDIQKKGHLEDVPFDMSESDFILL